MPPLPDNLFLTRQQVRDVDQRAVSGLGIPSIVLMENAARNTTAAVLELLRGRGMGGPGRSVRALILCGGGNNGGDGYAIARHLTIHGLIVTVLAAKDPAELTGDAAINCGIVQRMGLPVSLATDAASIQRHEPCFSDVDVIVDALLGTGFTGNVRTPLDTLITRCNAAAQAGTPIVSVDVPSGLDCETGGPAEPTVQATLTVTFVAQKTGFRSPAAQRCLGRVMVADIGVPPAFIQQILEGR